MVILNINLLYNYFNSTSPACILRLSFLLLQRLVLNISQHCYDLLQLHWIRFQFYHLKTVDCTGPQTQKRK